MLKSWLQEPMTVEEAEARHLVRNERLGPEPVPFGFLNDQWRALKAKMRAGDEIRAFTSPPASWAQLAGRSGVALVRDGEPVDWILLAMN